MSGKTTVTTQRVEEALDGIRPALRANGNDVELKYVEDNDAGIVLRGNFTGGYSSLMMLKFGIERKMREHIPDFGEVVLEMPG